MQGEWKWINWDITSIAKDWYTTGNNYGVMLKSENTANSIFCSSDIYVAGNRPQVTMRYINNSGLEDFWTFHSQDVGRAGTGYINDYNGNLVFIHNDISMNGNRMPVNLSHVYNSNQTNEGDINGKALGYGAGWRLNLSQRIVKEVIGGTTYYKYIDGDGTNHYFSYNSSTGKYEDELSKDLTLQLDYNNGFDVGYLIKDKNDNKLTFTRGGYLYKIIDNNGNELTLSYSDVTLKKIIDGAGRVTTLDVGSDGYLYGIIDPSGRRTSYSYNGNKLSSITYPDGKVTYFSYDSNNNLTEANDIDGYKVKYEYYNANPQRISKVYEVYNDGSNGQGINMTYGFNTTIFKDFSGVKNIYQFNDFGNTISIRDTDGSATYYKYGDVSSKNKLTLNSKLQKSVMNYLFNHNAEKDTYWNSVADTGSTGSSNYSSSIAYVGNGSISVNKTNKTNGHFRQQTIKLTKGKTYTFSGYIKTNNISSTNNKGAVLKVEYQDSAGNWKTCTSSYLRGTNEWERKEVAFTIPSNALSNTVNIKVGIEGEMGTANFDCLQLEDGEVANRYNLVENPSFVYNNTYAATFWAPTNHESNNELWTTTDSDYPDYLDESNIVYKMPGNPKLNKNIYQKINVSGKKGDSFIIAGWAKANSVPLAKGRNFSLHVMIEKTDNTHKWIDIPFNEDSLEWQYVSEVFIADGDYRSITVYGLYYYNANTACFDGFQLYREEFGNSYQYDKDGNIISTADLAKKSSQFEYNGNNDLIKVTDPKGNNFNYEYDGKHNITKATTAENVVYSFSYDSYGNPLTAKVGSSSDIITSTATYTSNGNYIDTVKDSNGAVVDYDYNTLNGNLDKVTDANGKSVSYTYDANTDFLKSVSQGNKGTTITNSYTYDNDKLTAISHNGQQYNFTYDKMDNQKTVSIGNNQLIENAYDGIRGRLSKATYGNGNTVSYGYDNLDRVTRKTFESVISGYIEPQAPEPEPEPNPEPNPDPPIMPELPDPPTKPEEPDLGGGVTNPDPEKPGIPIDPPNPPVEQMSWGNERLVGDSNKNPYSSKQTVGAKYSYDNVGNLAKVEDSRGRINHRYIYDLANRLSKIEDSNGNWFKYEYDELNKISKSTDYVGGTAYITAFTYDKDGRTTKIDLPSNKNIQLAYDSIGRVTTKKLNLGSKTIDTVYSYKPGTAGLTTTLVSSIKNGTSEIKYTYDILGRIETITKGGKTIKYYYDDLGQITREDNGELNKTIAYTYDNGGNIKFVKEYALTSSTTLGTARNTKSYSYGDAVWKDKLTSFNGKEITYDSIGNPLTYDGYIFRWETGRTLKYIDTHDKNIQYKYNIDGIRTEKQVNDVKYKYTLEGNQVVYEEITNGSKVDKIRYNYGDSGLIGFTLNNVEYFYIRNVQNDIIGILDVNGVEVVKYTYDSWGKVISVTGTKASTVGELNPYRYRGYRYDEETGFYYLQSRYYNPEWGRFINADGLTSTGQGVIGNNMFAYCLNNPVNMSDEYGFMPGSLYMADGGGKVNKPSTPKPPAPNKSNGSSVVNQVISWGQNITLSAGDSFIGNAIGEGLKESTKQSYKAKFVLAGNNVLQTFDDVPKTLKGAANLSKVGVGAIAVVSTGASIWDNHTSYSEDIAWKRSAIDGVAFLASCGIGAAATVLGLTTLPATIVGVIGGIGITLGANYIKKKISN